MELAVTKLAIICFFITGVSHILQPRVWARFFIDMRSKGEVGSFLMALLHFPLGALIASFHNVWHGLPVVLTLIGWGLVLKSFIYFTFPSHGVKMLARVSMERSWEFIVAGAFSVGISGLLTFSLLRR
jgi:predicted tellurium resistance membrane protein TerC